MSAHMPAPVLSARSRCSRSAPTPDDPQRQDDCGLRRAGERDVSGRATTKLFASLRQREADQHGEYMEKKTQPLLADPGADGPHTPARRSRGKMALDSKEACLKGVFGVDFKDDAELDWKTKLTHPSWPIAGNAKVRVRSSRVNEAEWLRAVISRLLVVRNSGPTEPPQSEAPLFLCAVLRNRALRLFWRDREIQAPVLRWPEQYADGF